MPCTGLLREGLHPIALVFQRLFFGRLLLQSALSSRVNDCLATLGHSISGNHPRLTKL